MLDQFIFNIQRCKPYGIPVRERKTKKNRGSGPHGHCWFKFLLIPIYTYWYFNERSFGFRFSYKNTNICLVIHFKTTMSTMTWKTRWRGFVHGVIFEGRVRESNKRETVRQIKALETELNIVVTGLIRSRMFCSLVWTLIIYFLCLSTSGESVSRVRRTRGCHPILPTETGPDSRRRRGCCATTWG